RNQPGPLSHFVARRAWPVLAIIAVLTLAAISQLFDLHSGQLRLRIDPSLDPLVAQDDPDRQYYEQVRRRFGNDETLLLVIDTTSVYSADSLKRLDRLTRALDDLPGVKDVSSLTNTPLAHAAPGSIHFERLSPEQFDDPNLPARLREAGSSNPLVR